MLSPDLPIHPPEKHQRILNTVKALYYVLAQFKVAVFQGQTINASMTIERKPKPCQQYNHLTHLPFLSINEFMMLRFRVQGSMESGNCRII